MAESTDFVPGAAATTASPDVIAMGVGAVMALHSVHEAKAIVALAEVAIRYQVPICDVARAVLTVVAGTGEPLGDRPGRAAVQLMMQGFTNSP